MFILGFIFFPFQPIYIYSNTFHFVCISCIILYLLDPYGINANGYDTRSFKYFLIFVEIYWFHGQSGSLFQLFYFRSPGPNILSVISYHSSSINFSHFIFYLSSILTKWYSELGGPQYHDLVPLILKFNMAARSIMLSYWVGVSL
jgi:hypothetical protein